MSNDERVQKRPRLEGVNILSYLEKANALLKKKFFKWRNIWRLTIDESFERHIDVKLMTADATVDAVRSIMYDRTALLYGESGSGKTATAILSCEEHDICIFMTPRVFADGGTELTELYSQLDAEEGAFFEQYAKLNAGETCDPKIPEVSGSIYKTLACIFRWPNFDAFTGNVVLVVDEAGSYPRLVRALCRERPSIVKLVKESMNVTGNVGLVVCGTGCENGGDTLGLYPPTVTALRCDPKPFREHVIKVMAEEGFVAIAELLSGEEPTIASYYHKMRTDSTSLAYVQRLMLNRRFSAALLSELNQSVPYDNSGYAQRNDKKIPWLTALPVNAIRALMKFKSLNRLGSQSPESTSALFTRALALCFGGPKQAITDEPAKGLQEVFGMITDNATVCTVEQADVSISVCESGRHLALPKSGAHFGRRVYMSPATVEMGLQRYSLNTVGRAHTDGAPATTVTDWIYCWCLACCADVPTITLLGEESGNIHAVRLAQDVDEKDATARQALLTVMMKMRDVLMAPQTKTAVVLRVLLTGEITSVEAAEKVAFAEAWALIGEANVPFVLVARNVPKASFADLFVVAGTTCTPSAAATTTALFVAIQVKHNTTPPQTAGDGKKRTAVQRKRAVQRKGADAPQTAGDGEKPNPFISLVLVMQPDLLDQSSSVFSTPVDTHVGSLVRAATVSIRSGALGSVMHPISLGADQRLDAPSSDAEKYDMRRKK